MKANNKSEEESIEERINSSQKETQSTLTSLKVLTSPAHQLIVIIVAIFLAGAIVTVLLANLSPLSTYEDAFLDSLLLIIILSPILYFVILRPLRLHITESKRVEKALRENEEKYRSLIESTDDSIYLVDRNSRYLYMNKRHIKRMGFSRDEYIGQAYSEFHTPEQTKEFIENVDKVFETGESTRHEHRSDRDGRYFLRTLSPVKGDLGKTVAVTVISKDITERKEMEEKLHSLSLTDELTGLYNRRGFFVLVEQLLKLSKRQKRGVFLLYADLDNLKGINDTFGHQEGDLALIDIANILEAMYRESDIIARIGGDEFVVIPVGSSGDSIERIALRLEENLKNHIAKKERMYKLSISFGISHYDPESPCSIDELVVMAEKLMYRQKIQKQKS